MFRRDAEKNEKIRKNEMNKKGRNFKISVRAKICKVPITGHFCNKKSTDQSDMPLVK